MPVSNITAARDAVYDRLKTVLAASAYPDIDVYYPDVTAARPDEEVPHIRVFMDHTYERQSSLGEVGNRRYRIGGIFSAQIFTPFGHGQVEADAISGVVKSAFRGVNTGNDAIEFRNVRVVDVGQDGAWLQTNVMTEFVYDEIA